MDRGVGTPTVRVRRIAEDQSEQPVRHDPSNPAANAQGYVKVPNVNSFIEMLDLREAQRTYSANLSVLEVSRGMINRTIELLR